MLKYFKQIPNVIKKDNLKTAGIIAGKLGKAIVIEGVKGVLLKSATKVITTSFEGGLEGVKQLGIDDYVGSKKKKKHVDVPNVKFNKEKARVEVDADFEEIIDLEKDEDKDQN